MPALIPLYLIFFGLPPAGHEPASNDSHLITTRLKDRVCKTFDFNERLLGNFEALPIHWRPVIAEGYPRFLEPQLDEFTGHAAPPSFRFELMGGNAGAVYLTRDIHVHPGCDYEITAWIKTRGLVHAGATLSAFFLDHAMVTIDDSETRCEPVRDVARGDDWQRVSLRLKGGRARSRWIGLRCDVMQSAAFSNSSDEPASLTPYDINAAAWFDDIRIMRLPHAVFSSPSAERLFQVTQPVELTVRVADLDATDLRAQIRIHDSDGREVWNTAVHPVEMEAPAETIAIDNLSPGRYLAVLEVQAGNTLVHRKQLSFAVLTPLPTFQITTHSGLGITLQADSLRNPEQTARLIKELRPSSVRVPLSPPCEKDASTASHIGPVGELIRALDGTGIDIIVLMDLPQPDESAIAGLKELLIRHAGHLTAVQFEFNAAATAHQTTRDMNRVAWIHSRLEKILDGVRVAISWNPLYSLPSHSRNIFDAFVVRSSTDMKSSPLAELTPQAGIDKLPRQWIDIPRPCDDALSHRARRDYFARLLLDALAAGTEFVFAPQPWSLDPAADVSSLMLEDQFVTCRTIAGMLAGLKGIGSLWVEDGIDARLFTDDTGRHGVLVLWTTGHDAPPKRITLDLPQATTAADLLGKRFAVSDEPQGRSIEVGPSPIYLTPVDPASIATAASFHINDPNLVVAVTGTMRTVLLTNQLTHSLRGSLIFQLPEGWGCSPSWLAVDLAPGQTREFPVQFRLPTNQTAGPAVLRAVLQPERVGARPLNLSAPLRVGSSQIDAQAMTYVEADHIVVFQRLTNRSDHTLQLRCTLLGGGLPTQTRWVNDLPPGESSILEFAVPRSLAQESPRLRIRVDDARGSLVVNQLLAIEGPHDEETTASDSTVGVIRPAFTSMSNRSR